SCRVYAVSCVQSPAFARSAYLFSCNVQDAIRASSVSGLQRCALPIWGSNWRSSSFMAEPSLGIVGLKLELGQLDPAGDPLGNVRSEERRVGDESRCRR